MGRIRNKVTNRLLLDCSSLMYRAFFAIPASVRGPGGNPVNAVYGYLDMVGHLIGSRLPHEVVHVYDDDWRPAERVAAYARYKGQRPPDPEGLPEQFELLRRVLDAFGFAQADAEGWEAEDAIGSICARGGREDRFEIVTGDRDLIQLVRDPAVRVLFTVRGVSELRVLDEAGVLERFGVPASRYAEFAVLRGDPSDGLPGVRGVGEKTARALVAAYPSIDALLEDARSERRQGAALQRSRSLVANLRADADYLEAMKLVVPIRLDLEVRRWQPEPDPAALDELAEAHALQSPVGRLRAALSDAQESG